MAIRLTKIYTRTGDKGLTALVGGKRVPKESGRLEAYGTIDELNSIVGIELATPADFEYPHMHKMGTGEVKKLEIEMDAMERELEPLKSFTLPGGGVLNAFLHQARTVCRRAERILWALKREEDINDQL